MSFGIANNVRSEVRVCTPDLLNEALDSAQVARTCAEIEDALEKYRRGELSQEDFETLKGQLKKRLPILTPHATFKNGRRLNADAIPSGLSMYDLDHIPNPREKWAEIEPRKEALGIVFAHITPSTEGLRLFFVIPQGMTLAEAQAWIAAQLGDDKYDACVKDYARSSFIVPREYVLYLHADCLFAPQSTQSFFGQSPQQHVTENIFSENGVHNNINIKELSETQCHSVVPPKETYPKNFKGIPYAVIIEEWFRKNGGEPEKGERNTKLHRLASHLRYITDNDEAHLLQILPGYGLNEEEMKSLIHHACTAKFYGMPRTLKKLLSDLERTREKDEEINEEEAGTNFIDSPFPPPMPRRLPPLIKLLVSNTPHIYRPAVAHAVFPALGAHLWKTYFRYIDNVEHEATLMNVLMAGTGAGKNCISEPINRIMKDIRLRDKENLQREKDWKDEMQTKGANKDKRKRPEGLVIQELDPDATNAAFVRRISEADERFLYAKMNEIEQFDALKASNYKNSHFQIMCLAFDPGNIYGQTRVGIGSVSERVCIRFNWNASTTIHKGQAYFRNVLTDGPISRINFCTIPERPIGSEMPVYGTYDAAFDEELRPYIERLTKARGLVECHQVKILAKKLMEENAEFARLTQSRVYENLSFRANVIAFLKAMVLFVAHGGMWDKTMEEFVRWSLKYDMYCKMCFFGEAIENLEYDGSITRKRGPQNLLDLLPDIFTYDEAKLMRNRQNITHGSVGNMLSTWKKRKYIETYGEKMEQNNLSQQQFIKTAAYLKRR